MASNQLQNGGQQRQGARSPSPPPPAPVALTPGPRASRLQQVFTQALARTVRANSYENFSSCFPTPAKHVPRSLESVWRQLNAKLEESAKAEFEAIVQERDVVRGLNELDRLVGEARNRRENGAGEEPTRPHTLTGPQLYQAHLAPHLDQIHALLDTKIQDTETQNSRLAENIQNQRQEINQLLAGLEAVFGDIQGATTASREFDSQKNLRTDAMEMDEEVKRAKDRDMSAEG